MNFKLLTTIILFLFSTAGFSQSWIRELQKTNPDFYKIKKKAERYYKDEIRELNYQMRHANLKDSKTDEDEGAEGYHIYKRWEQFWQPRVNADGSFPPPDAVHWEMQLWLQKYNPNKFQTQGTWIPKGPFTPVTGPGQDQGVGRINGMAVNPLNNNEIYACAPSGGIWKSTTGGNNFTTTTDQLAAIGFTSIVVDYTNPNIVYAASGEGDGQVLVSYSLGVLKSTDGGLTWNPTGLSWKKKNIRQTQKIIMDPIDHNVLLVATSSGIYRTNDGASTWTMTKSGQMRDMEFKPGNSNIVYASSDNALIRSTDNGVTWSIVSSGLPSTTDINRLSIAVTPANPDYVYALAGSSGNSGFYGLYQSTDAGLTFNLKSNTPNICGWEANGTDVGGISWYALAIAVDPTNAEHLLAGSVNLWESYDGGQTFTLNAHWYDGNYNYVHADIHYLDFTGNTLFCGSDGGLWKSSDFGSSWTDISGGMQISQFYRLGCSEINSALIFTGAQDNGSFRLNNTTWTKVRGGDGFEQVISPLNVNVIFSETQNNGLARSTNGGGSFTSITNGLSGTADWNTPFLVNNSGVLYVGRQDIFKSVNNGSSYVKLTNGGMGVLKFMAICKTAQSVMYATDGAGVYKINLNTGSVTNVTNGLTGSISHVAVADNDSNRVYVTISGFTKANKVFMSTDGGLTWSNISSNLPNIPAVSIAVQNDSLEGIYLGTDAGVFYRNNNFSNWQLFMNGLPNAIIDELEINYASGKIRAATYGRGLWESDFYLPSPPVAAFTEDRRIICPNQTVTFTDISTEGPTSNQWTFPGGIPAVATGTTVTVTYPTAGMYDVSLAATNTMGTGSITKTLHINVTNNQQSLPVNEGFENGPLPAGWSVENTSGDPFAWKLSNVGSYSSSNHSYVCENFDAEISGTVTNLEMQNYDLTTISNPELKFDVAYAKRTPPRNDTLKIEASTDCGATWTTIYNKGGNTLKTSSTYYMNDPFVPLAGEWRTDYVSLSSLASQPQVWFRFTNVTARGNNIYIDNINIDVAAGIMNVNNDITATLYPNPVNDVSLLSVHATTKNNHSFQLLVYNVLGEQIKTILPVSTVPLSFEIKKSDFNSGVFIYELVNVSKQVLKGKFVVE